MVEYAWVPGVVSAAVAFWSLVRVEQVRKLSTGDELRQKMIEEIGVLRRAFEVEGSILRGKIEILQLESAVQHARLKPLMDSFDTKLAEIFHKPHPSAQRLDALIEEFGRNAEKMSDQRFQELMNEAWDLHQQAGKSGLAPDPFTFFTAGLWHKLMEGRWNERQILRAHGARLRELEANQVQLEAQRQQIELDTTHILDSAPTQEPLSWLTRGLRRLKTYLDGSD